MTKHTLYITFDGLSDPLGQSQILPYIKGLSENGFSITVLSCEKQERLNKEENNIRSLLKTTNITWQYIIYNEVGGFLTRLSYIRRIFSIAEKEHAEKKFKLIHCRSYLSALIGLKFRKKFSIPFLFDMRGFWANERIDGKIWNNKNPLHIGFYKYFKFKEKQFLYDADAIVSLTHAGKKILDQQFTNSSIDKKTTVIPCCVNTSLFNPHGVPPVNITGISPEDHLLIYTGSIGTWYYTKEMIDCVLEWRSLIPNIKLLIVTKDKSEIENILSGYSPEEKKLIKHTSASYSQMPGLLALAKASIFFIKPAFSKIASSPTKMAECWAMNLPIITNKGIGDNDLYFNQMEGGVLVNDFNKEEYLIACQKYLALTATKKNYREIALRHFDTVNAVKSYCKIYNSLIR